MMTGFCFRFPVDESKLKPFLESRTLQSAMDAGSIFILDFHFMEDLTFLDSGEV